MIQEQTILKVSDNSGAKNVQCIKVLGGFKKKYAKLGGVIIVSVKELRNRSKLTSKIKKKEVYKALIVKTRRKFVKKDGLTTFIDSDNSVALMNKKGMPIATRITSPIPVNLKKKKMSKFINISPGLI